ncbi:MAG: hypothetical protein Q8S17_08730 [Humidesulfovibrio sp.]|nr:hypothetical protein [Humidesulfovibrio sp.]
MDGLVLVFIGLIGIAVASRTTAADDVTQADDEEDNFDSSSLLCHDEPFSLFGWGMGFGQVGLLPIEVEDDSDEDIITSPLFDDDDSTCSTTDDFKELWTSTSMDESIFPDTYMDICDSSSFDAVSASFDSSSSFDSDSCFDSASSCSFNND